MTERLISLFGGVYEVLSRAIHVLWLGIGATLLPLALSCALVYCLPVEDLHYGSFIAASRGLLLTLQVMVGGMVLLQAVCWAILLGIFIIDRVTAS